MENQLILKERVKVIIIIIFAYILPVLFIFLGWVPFSWRFIILILVNIVICLIAKLYRFPPVELGFTRKNLEKSLKAIAVPTLGLILLMFIYYVIYGPRLDNSAYGWPFYVFFVVVSSPVQEFLYRGFLFSIFARVNVADWLKILLSTLLYSFVHLIYRDLPTLLLTLLLGLFWGWHYRRFRNLYSTIVSHSLIGAIAILVGLI